MAEKKTAPKATKVTKAAAKSTKKVELPKTLPELLEMAETVRTDILEAKRSLAQGELVNPHILTVKRKQLARVLTAVKAVEASEKGEK